MEKKSIIALISTLFFSVSAWAMIPLEPLLNKVTFQLEAEQWAVTKTALVNVNVNASVTDQGIEKIQADVLDQLKLLSNAGEWHVVSFDRQEDQSGLERIQIIAQARLPQTELANLRGKAKNISKPGVTFTIDNVQFTPSDAELRAVKNILRHDLYEQAKAEVETLNKIYPDQKFYLHQINFITSPIAPMPAAYGVRAMSVENAPQRPALPVGNKEQLRAIVTIAAMPEQVSQQLTR